MNIEAQKVRLIERIVQVDDPSVIDQINAILEQDENDFYDELTDEQKASVQRGLAQVTSGETIPHAEVSKIYQRWL
ncbi:MAG: hypothetical protein WA960_08385 [Tunicatimonas sp.]